MAALRRAHATVLVLPCGRSAHLELGYAVADGQRTLVLFDESIDEHLCVSMEEVLDALR
jgi:hypothetical protein